MGFLDINSNTQIADLELDSIFITRVYSEINKLFPNSIEIADLYSLETIGELAKKIEEKSIIPDFKNGTSKLENSSTINDPSEDEYAIIGIDLNIGNNQNKEEFYNSLLAGEKFTSSLSPKRIKVFDLKNGPLFRIKLLQSSSNNSILLFDAHHIIFDFQSMKVFLSQLITLYNKQEVPESTIDYTDYSEWYNQQIKINHQLKLQEWVNELKDAPINLEVLPATIKSNTVSSIGLAIDSTLLEKLEKYSAKENVSLFSVLLAAYFKTTSAIEKNDKQVVGIPVSGRDFGNVNNVIGLFRNSLPIYVDLSKVRNDSELVLKTQSRILSAMEKQEIQTYEIEEAMGENNLFNNYFIYQDSISSDNFKMDGLEIQTELIRKQGMFNIKWEFVKIDGCLQAVIEYRNELFNESEIMYLKKYFLEILKGIIKE